MAKPSSDGTWLLAQELFEAGDPEFVDRLREVDRAPALAAFAGRWYADRRPASRRLLLDYLGRPLNAFRHEPLIKRLFKLAEAAGDDEVMARFLVLFDRSVRRVQARVWHREWRQLESVAEAAALVARWHAEGYEDVTTYQYGKTVNLMGRWSEEIIRTPAGTAMPRDEVSKYRNPRTGDRIVDLDLKRMAGLGRLRDGGPLPESARRRLDRLRLFSVATRNYLRRRSWRYFRRLGRDHPERYVAAVVGALAEYTEQDVADGLALIDNWGLVHILFHHSPVLVGRPGGWRLAEGRSLSELEPAPIYGPLWRAAPRAFFDLLTRGRCRAVRHWAVRMVRQDSEATLGALPVEEWLALLGSTDAEVIALAADTLRGSDRLRGVEPARWLALVEASDPAALGLICDLMAENLDADRVSFAQAVRLAASRPLPSARLGLSWLRVKTPQAPAEFAALLGLVEAESEPLRPEIVRWARGVLGTSPDFRPDWVLEYLDSRHADVRAEGWAWLLDEPRARDDVDVWRKLLESPHDDVKIRLVADLERRVARLDPGRDERQDLDPELLRGLWASVLLNIHRGGRAKPMAVRQLVRRLGRRPDEAPRLLPILGVALRSVRGPEWRAGLAAVVQLAERHPEAVPSVRRAFPELQWT